jgi:stage V sporulation protein AB
MREITGTVIGFAGGLLVGGGMAALFTLLQIVPRLLQVARCRSAIRWMPIGIMGGSVAAVMVSLGWMRLDPGKAVLLIAAVLMGVFVGMLAMALAEALQMLTITVKHGAIARAAILLIIAMAGGKLVGSVLYWIIPGLQK